MEYNLNVSNSDTCIFSFINIKLYEAGWIPLNVYVKELLSYRNLRQIFYASNLA